MDSKIQMVNAQYPDEFEQKVNGILAEGNWRVAETEMSITDHHYWALLIKEKVLIMEAP